MCRLYQRPYLSGADPDGAWLCTAWRFASAKDAIMASLFAEKAIDSLLAGTYNCVIGQIGERIVATPYTEAERLHFPLDENMYRLVLELGR